uniref:Uncharacterized protein n=1 Tax=Daucus carota subsp. sativus TaxID=79200 RepID=A0A164TG95_DAUCS
MSRNTAVLEIRITVFVSSYPQISLSRQNIFELENTELGSESQIARKPTSGRHNNLDMRSQLQLISKDSPLFSQPFKAYPLVTCPSST